MNRFFPSLVVMDGHSDRHGKLIAAQYGHE